MWREKKVFKGTHVGAGENQSRIDFVFISKKVEIERKEILPLFFTDLFMLKVVLQLGNH